MNGRFYYWGLPQLLGFYFSDSTHIVSYQYKVFCIIIYSDAILVLIYSKYAGKRRDLFLFFLVHLGLCINFPIFELCLTQSFCLLELFWDTVDLSMSLPTVKLLKIQQLSFSLFQMQFM